MIRRASPWDIPAIWAMESRFWNSTYAHVLGLDEGDCRRLLEGMITSHMAYVGVDYRGQAVAGAIGCLLGRHRYNQKVLVATEVFWYVLPEYRGAGPRLLMKMEQWARSKGASAAAASDPDGGIGGMLERMGYSKVETQYIKPLG